MELVEEKFLVVFVRRIGLLFNFLHVKEWITELITSVTL